MRSSVVGAETWSITEARSLASDRCCTLSKFVNIPVRVKWVDAVTRLYVV